jgi:hypothetical protein
MDRVIVQIGALPQDTDILQTNKFGLQGLARFTQAVLGSSTVIAGLTCTPTTPTASLQVNVGAGTIYQMDPTDASAYGSLGIDNTNIMKQGILASPAVLTITPPSTSGFSQVYLVEAILNDADGGAMVESYFNSANPLVPFAGPSNSGSSNFSTRTSVCAIALKAGNPASTGTQVAPSPDAGYVALYTITVANGQTQITSTSIAQLASAPFFPTLPQVPAQVQQGIYVYAGQDTGAANAYVITFGAGQPIPTAYTVGMEVKFKALNANTGASTVNVNGLGTISIRRGNGIALAAADIASGGLITLTYDGTYFQMSNYLGSGTNTNSSTVVGVPYVTDTGAQNAIVATYSPAITSGQQVAGLTLEVKLANNITGACTINVSGLGTKAVKTGDLQNAPPNVYVAGEVLLLAYDGTQYQIANSTSLIYRKPSGNVTIYVNGAIGSDTLYDGTAASISGGSGPFATIGMATLAAWAYAPSPFTITISIAAGTYNESVQTPSYAGSTVIYSGAGPASTILNSPASYTSGIYALVVASPSPVQVLNMRIQGGTAGLVSENGGANVYVNNVTFNGNWLVGQAVWCTGGFISVGNITISSSMNCVFNAEQGGTISFAIGSSVTFSTPISISTGVAFTSIGGNITVNIGAVPIFINPSYVSGPKYLAQGNGVIYAQSQGYSFFPGSSAGSLQTGGQYLP